MRRRTIGNDLAVNLLIPLIPMVVAVIAVPVYIALIGLERFGILSFVWLLTGLFALFDPGLGTATNRAVAQRGDAPPTALGNLLAAALLSNLVLGMGLAALFLWPIGPLAFASLTMSEAVRGELMGAMPSVALLLPAVLLDSVLRGAAEGRRAFIATNTIQCLGQVGATVGALGVAALVSPRLDGLIAAIVAARLATTLALLGLNAPLLSRARAVDVKGLLGLLRFGGWTAAFHTLSLALSSLDRFVIASLSGSITLALYTIPYSLVQRSQVVAHAVTRTLFPHLCACENTAERRTMAARMMAATLGALGTVCVPAVVMMDTVMTAWLGAALGAKVAPVATLLTLAFWVVAGVRTIHVYLIASGTPERAALLRLWLALPFALTLGVLVAMFGATGAAIALLTWWSAEFLVGAVWAKLTTAARRCALPWLPLWLAAFVMAAMDPGVFGALCGAFVLGIGAAALALRQSSDLRRFAGQAMAKGWLALQRHHGARFRGATSERPSP
ncbi:MAG: oligosaccharide flippase family protein [Pseudomonadota bacterium]